MQNQPLFARPVYLLRAEALCFLVASCGAYHLIFPHHWVLFACLFLVPDLSLLLFLRGPNIAAGTIYNLAHSYVGPSVLGMLAVLLHKVLFGEVSLIWIAHIGMDRMVGYGLKYPQSFKFTHIQSTANPAIEPVPPHGQGE
jgi:hypothetical protein